jgi:large repetitive protein
MGHHAVRRALAVLLFAHAGLAAAQEADLAVTKNGPATAAAGSDVVFQVGVTNLGPDAAANIALNDPLPPGMTFVAAGQTGGPAFVCSTPAVGDPGVIACTAAALAPGASATFDFTLRIPAGTAPGTFFTNIATAANDVFDPNGKNDSAVANTQTPAAASADLRLDKQAPAAAIPDSGISYTITLQNLGPDAAGAVSWTDTLPGDLTFTSLSQGPGPVFSCVTPAVGAGGTVTCTRPDFAAAATTTFTLVAHVPPGAASGTEYTNTASVVSTADPNSENDADTVVTTVSAVNLGVSKTGAAAVTAGQNQTYMITLDNAGPDTALGVALSDVLPAQTTFVSLNQASGPVFVCTTPAVGAAGQIGCQLDAMASSAAAVFTLVVNVSPLHPGGVLSNTAQVSTESFDTATGNNSSTTNATVAPLTTDLSVGKTAPATVLAGQMLSYTLELTNLSSNPALGVMLTDTLPAGTGFVSLTQNSGPLLSCATPAAGGGGTVTCSAAQLAGGATAALTLIVSVPAATAHGTPIANTATASSTNPDTVPANNSGNASTQVVNQADLAVSKSGPAAAAAGQNQAYTIGITNNGPSAASGVTFNDTLPAGTRFVSLQQVTGPLFTCTTPAAGATGSVACSLAALPSGGSATFTLTLSLDASLAHGTAVVNSVNAAAAGSDPNPANNSASASTQVSNQADLGVTKSGAAAAAAGQNHAYSIAVTNNGPQPASAVTLNDLLPAGTRFVSLQQNTGPVFTCTTPAAGTSGNVACSLASLPAGGSATFTLTVALDAGIAMGTVVTNSATATAANNDPVPANNTASSATTISNVVDLVIGKTGPATLQQGEVATYAITVSNTGSSPALNVQFTDPYPAGTTFVSLTQTAGPPFNCVPGASTATCSIASLAGGASASFALLLDTDNVAPGMLSNTVSASSTSLESGAANNAATAATALVAGNLALRTVPALDLRTLAALALLMLLMAAGFRRRE